MKRIEQRQYAPASGRQTLRVFKTLRVSATLPGWASLAALGGLSVAVVWVGLVWPYNLFALRLAPLVNIAKLTRGQPVAQARFVLTLAALSAAYYLAWRVCRAGGRDAGSRRAMWLALAGSLLALNVLMVWLYPVGAADIFDNIARGRITAHYGGNPFYDVPRAYPRDLFRYYVAWPWATSAYGPLWELMAAATSRLAGESRLANVLAFKGLGLLFYAASAWLVARLLRARAPERALQGVCLFAWNPLVIYETAGNGHNDIVLVFFVLLALWALDRRRYTAAVLALVAGALVKFIPIVLVPIVAAAAWRALPSRRRLGFAAATLGLSAALAAALTAPFWRGGDMLALERRSTLFTASLPAVAQVNLAPALGVEASQRVVAGLALLATAAVVARQTWRAWRDPGWQAPIRASAHVLLFYLLFTCLWFQPWYALWPLALAALLPEGALARTIVLLSYAAAWKTIIFDYFIFRAGPLPPLAWRETLLGPATLGLAWVYVAFRAARRQARRAAARARPAWRLAA
jgi:hypothetical protein